MNLVLLIGAFPPGPFGGAETQAESWARRLARHHHVTVVTRRIPHDRAPRETRDGFELVTVPVHRAPVWRTFADRAAIARVVEALTPRPDMTLCFQTFVSGWVGIHLQRRFGIPAVVWVRGEDEFRIRRRWRARVMGPRVWAAARGVIVQSDEIRTALTGELSAARRTQLAPRLAVVPNGIDLPELSVAPRGARVLTVGRLRAVKGMDVVIDAVAGMQGLLTLAGDGPDRAALERRARRHGLDARFLGHVDAGTLSTQYRAAACVVLASRFGEGFPNVLLEAMAYGCAVVATRVTGVGELVEDGVNGLLVPPGDPLALRAALARIAHERGLAERLGRAARVTAERYRWDAVEPRLEALLEGWRVS